MAKRPTAEPGPRKPLSREQVLRAGLELADEGGIDALTMRGLGRRLGVEAMSLYNHVENKDDVLDGMLDLVAGEMDLPSGDVDWREAMRRRAVSARAVFARHPWASALMDARESSGPERMRYFEWVIGTLRRAGFSVELALRAFSAIDSYVYGFGRQQLNISAAEGDPKEMAAAFLSAIPADEFPYLREVITEHALTVGYDEAADFEFGLGLILDGLERVRDKARHS
ncbi:MAG TPA: TetR/AcrR family transcriptional regulator [Methanoregulaceae archaeon]|nr:TetR/AcrR family transcriptional regulator [Methanoregulaceae archaeon]